MTPQEVVPIVITGIVLVIILWASIKWLHSGNGVAYVMEPTDEVDGERTLLVNMVLAVLQYNLQKLHVQAPEATTSPDGYRSYINIVTLEGHVMLQFDWLHSKVYCFYSYHDNDVNGTISLKLKIRHNVVDEIKLSEFCKKVVETEMQIIENVITNSEDFKNLLLQALSSAGAEANNQEEEQAVQVVLNPEQSENGGQ